MVCCQYITDKMVDERNFRSQFYEKVGLREVEEKRAVEALLKEQPMNERKFANFAQRSIVPATNRTAVWKFLLGITPRYAESQEYVGQQQTLMFEELWRALKSLGLGNVATLGEETVNGHDSLGNAGNTKFASGSKPWSDVPLPEHYLLMWLMSEAKLLFDIRQQLRTKQNQHFIAIARKVSCFFDTPVDIYHVCASIWSLLLKNEQAILDAIQDAIGMLRKENDYLHLHLFKMGLFSSSLLKHQCFSLFCDIFPETAIEKILDKIFAGAFRVLSFVIVAMLVHQRRPLIATSSVEGVRNVISNIRKEEAEIIVTSALDHWLKVGVVKRG